MDDEHEERWSVTKSADLYQIRGWGKPYFTINELGRVQVIPDPTRAEHTIDLFELVNDLDARGLHGVFVSGAVIGADETDIDDWCVRKTRGFAKHPHVELLRDVAAVGECVCLDDYERVAVYACLRRPFGAAHRHFESGEVSEAGCQHSGGFEEALDGIRLVAPHLADLLNRAVARRRRQHQSARIRVFLPDRIH